MKKHGLITMCLLTLACSVSLHAQKRDATEKPGPQKSGFYSFWNLSAEFEIGLGNVSNLFCVVGALTQPAVYAGNMLVDCDGEVPHNETTITVNPNDPNHAAGGYHSYQLNFRGATLVLHVIGTTSVTFNGGQTWREVVPPITPYQFSGDPALAFDSSGRLYFANIADNEGQGGNFTGPSVVVAHSDDGGLSWSNPVTVAKGLGAVDPLGVGQLIFNDKEFLAVDTSATSPHQNRVYVTWTSFQEFFSAGGHAFFRFPIMVSFSDNGLNWSAGKEISGFHPACSVQFGGGTPNRCEENQDSYPAVVPGGKVYVSFENFNTPAENQVMVVRSLDGGNTWSPPVRVDTLFDVNFPTNADHRDTLTGCQFRVSAKANTAADPSDPSGNTVYVVWADNRNGTAAATNTDVFLARSTDGGVTWTVHTIDGSANDQFYPWVAVAPGGRVDVGYMDRSYSAGQGVCQYGFTLARVTFPGGIPSVTRTRVDTGLSDPGHSRWFSALTGGNSLFIGDYNGVAVGSDGVTWSLWTDQRNIVPNPPAPARNHGQHAVGARTAP